MEGLLDMSQVKIAPYDWAKLLNFSAGGNAGPYCGTGWGQPEDGMIWTDGPNARLHMLVKPPASDVSLVLSCFPFLGDGKVPYQELTVFVNFLRVGFAVVAQPSEIEVLIPKWVFKEPQTQIDLYIPKATSPQALGIAGDVRQLGLAINRMMMMQV
jgi:hypothetical protein